MMVSHVANSETCDDIFRPESARQQANVTNTTADAFWLGVAKYESADLFAKSLNETHARSSLQTALYENLIAPALWTYARLALDNGQSSQQARALTARLSTPRRAHTPMTESDRMLYERPKVMTAAERRDAINVGHFGNVDRHLPAQTKEGERASAFAALLRRSQIAAGISLLAKSTSAVQKAFESMHRAQVVHGPFTRAELDSIVANPIEFALVYASRENMIIRLQNSPAAEARFYALYPRIENSTFSRLVPLVELAQAAREGAPEASRRAMDNIVIETIEKYQQP